MKIAVLGSSLAARVCALELDRRGHEVTLLEGPAETIPRRAGVYARLRTWAPPQSFSPVGRSRHAGLLTRVSEFAQDRLLLMRHRPATDWETTEAWLRRLRIELKDARELVQAMTGGAPHNTSAKMVESVLMPWLRGGELVAPYDDVEARAIASLPARPAGPAARTLEIERFRLKEIELADGGAIRPDLAIAALPPESILSLLPAPLREAEPYFRGIGQFLGAAPHAPGAEARRPRAESPVENLLLVGAYVRTGLPVNLESALASVESAIELIERRPAIEPLPSAAPSLVPASHLLRRASSSAAMPGSSPESDG